MSTYTEVMRNIIGPVDKLHIRNTNPALGVFHITKDSVITLKINEATGDIEMKGALVEASVDSIQESGV